MKKYFDIKNHMEDFYSCGLYYAIYRDVDSDNYYRLILMHDCDCIPTEVVASGTYQDCLNKKAELMEADRLHTLNI